MEDDAGANASANAHREQSPINTGCATEDVAEDNEVQVTQPPDHLMEEHNMAVEETSTASLDGEVKEGVPRSSTSPPLPELSQEDVTSSQQNIHSEDTGVTNNTPANSLLDISHVPIMVAHATSDFTRSTVTNNFLKGCKWAPDGSCVLTCSDDNHLKIFNLPAALYNNVTERCTEELQSVRWIKEGETIYDYCWYPLMTSFDAATCCFAATGRDGPIHLWDGFDGSLRCSYIAHNHLDELVTTYGLNFTTDGSQLLSGFHKCIRVFATACPGRQCTKIDTNKDKLGQSGIISCFAPHPADPSIFAAGSYSGSVGIYSLNNGGLQSVVQGHSGGITHLLFSADGNYLFSGGRKDPDILCWDMRNPGSVLMKMQRIVETNQRMYFDLDSVGQYLVSGNHNGCVSIWDTRQTGNTTTSLSFLAHQDCVNGISLHPTLPLIATTSGQRKFPLFDCDSSDDSDSDTSDSVQENSLKLWAMASRQHSHHVIEEST